MKVLLKLEEIGMFLLSIVLFSFTDYSWWVFLLLILLPDVSMIGYVLNTKIGAIFYNFFHHKAVAVMVLSVGLYIDVDWLILSGVILFGHASMDRIFGYGLKYSDSFHHTHQGWIGKKDE